MIFGLNAGSKGLEVIKQSSKQMTGVVVPVTWENLEITTHLKQRRQKNLFIVSIDTDTETYIVI